MNCETVIEKGRTIPKVDHTWDHGVVTKEATLATTGLKLYTCEKCGETKEVVIPATNETVLTEAKVPPETEASEKTEQANKQNSDKMLSASAPIQSSEMDKWGNSIVSEQIMEKTVLAMTLDNDLPGSSFSLLQARAKKVDKTSIVIAWKKVPGAVSYTVYGNKCGKGNKYQEIAAVNSGQYILKGLKKGTYYKFLIVACGGGKAKAVSKTIHVATTGGKVGNIKSVKITSKKSVTLKKGKTSKITARAIAKSNELKVKKHRELAYETDDPEVATVTKKGVIKSVGFGSCSIYVYAQNGMFAKVKVHVK